MKVDQDAFIKALLKPRVKVGTEWVNKGQNLEQVREQLVIKYGLFY
jgi:myosin heavy subunit